MSIAKIDIRKTDYQNIREDKTGDKIDTEKTLVTLKGRAAALNKLIEDGIVDKDVVNTRAELERTIITLEGLIKNV